MLSSHADVSEHLCLLSEVKARHKMDGPKAVRARFKRVVSLLLLIVGCVGICVFNHSGLDLRGPDPEPADSRDRPELLEQLFPL